AWGVAALPEPPACPGIDEPLGGPPGGNPAGHRRGRHLRRVPVARRVRGRSGAPGRSHGGAAPRRDPCPPVGRSFGRGCKGRCHPLPGVREQHPAGGIDLLVLRLDVRGRSIKPFNSGSNNRVRRRMGTVAAKTQYTPEDLLRMPDGDSYELVNGKLVERKTG